MSQRIFLRTLRFVAYSWWLPFIFGALMSMTIVAYTEIEVIQLMDAAFESAITKVVAQCVQ